MSLQNAIVVKNVDYTLTNSQYKLACSVVVRLFVLERRRVHCVFLTTSPSPSHSVVILKFCGISFVKGSAMTGISLNRPNVVVILADDMGFADLGCTGSEICTPHIDKLANDGVLLTSMYNCARCCPTSCYAFLVFLPIC